MCHTSGLKGLGSGVRRRAPAANGFWRILKAIEWHNAFCTYMTKYEGAICISVPYSKFCWTCPRPSRPPCCCNKRPSKIKKKTFKRRKTMLVKHVQPKKLTRSFRALTLSWHFEEFFGVGAIFHEANVLGEFSGVKCPGFQGRIFRVILHGECP